MKNLLECSDCGNPVTYTDVYCTTKEPHGYLAFLKERIENLESEIQNIRDEIFHMRNSDYVE